MKGKNSQNFSSKNITDPKILNKRNNTNLRILIGIVSGHKVFKYQN